LFFFDRARQYLGYGTYELIGQTFFHFVHPDDLPIVARAHRLCRKIEIQNWKTKTILLLIRERKWKWKK
jgi:hypothetical protein